jgi:transcriptional regulator with XRE-family HTH domain
MKTRPEYDFRVIGHNLKQLRMAKKLTVEDVREYMQLGSVQAVYKWERGDSLPQADSLMALLDLYNVHNFEVLIQEESVALSSSFALKISEHILGCV